MYLVQLPERRQCSASPLLLLLTLSTSKEILTVPRNMKLIALPLFELYDNAVRSVLLVQRDCARLADLSRTQLWTFAGCHSSLAVQVRLRLRLDFSSALASPSFLAFPRRSVPQVGIVCILSNKFCCAIVHGALEVERGGRRRSEDLRGSAKASAVTGPRHRRVQRSARVQTRL